MFMKKRVVVAMSGGVDSSVAAALLQEKGFEVIGITMCFPAYGGPALGANSAGSTSKRPTCCGVQGIEDARRVAHRLEIKHYVLNMQGVLEEYVIKNFCQEYLKGRTPNPCVRCNQYIKFGALLKRARSLNAEYLATGHYARIQRAPSSKLQAPSYLLKKAKDKLKDQSYFLYRLSQRQLRHIIFPVGNYTKSQVRQLAAEFNLPVADKMASQEICFLPDMDYRRLLKMRSPADIKPGFIVDQRYNVLGQHQGIAFFTIGQREGLGIAKGFPLYVTKIDSKNNRIIVGEKEDAFGSEFLVREPHFILKPIKKKVAVKVKIRYNHSEAAADILPFGNKIKVFCKKPQFAITPGQSAVFYDKDKVLGGGIIEVFDNPAYSGLAKCRLDKRQP
jgi:tRNA-specific 2-thiouridylase